MRRPADSEMKLLDISGLYTDKSINSLWSVTPPKKTCHFLCNSRLLVQSSTSYKLQYSSHQLESTAFFYPISSATNMLNYDHFCIQQCVTVSSDYFGLKQTLIWLETSTLSSHHLAAALLSSSVPRILLEMPMTLHGTLVANCCISKYLLSNFKMMSGNLRWKFADWSPWYPRRLMNDGQCTAKIVTKGVDS